MVSGFAAAWSSIFIASLCAALQLAASGTSPANIAIPAMGGIHALIGVGEGLITTGALAFLLAARKDLVIKDEKAREGNKGILLGGGLLVLLLAVLSPLASTHPDGLEWVAGQYGFLDKAREAFYKLIPDYMIRGIANPALSTIAAALIGSAVVFSLALGIARIEKRKAAHQKSTE